MHAMDLALREARAAAARGEVPVGAALVGPDGAVLACSGNRVEELNDVTAHAELLVMRQASRQLQTRRLLGCELVVTLEPCAMCAAAVVLFRPRRVIFGAYDAKGGGVEHGARVFAAPGCLYRPEIVGGMQEAEGGQLLTDFFQALRL